MCQNDRRTESTFGHIVRDVRLMDIDILYSYVIDITISMDDDSKEKTCKLTMRYLPLLSNSFLTELCSRHWRITDATGHVEHVDGEGVIGII